MKPLGRKHYKDKTGGKHSDWWEDVCVPNKRLEGRNAKKEIEEQLETVGDWLSLEDEEDFDYCDGKDWFCQDGVCPTCNYNKYLKWITDHGHCETGSWDCPDEEDCPWKKGLFDFK
jgi:hypothetical protein